MNAILDEIGYTGARITEEEGSAHNIAREMNAIRRHFLVFASQHTGTDYIQDVRARFQRECSLLSQQCRAQELRASIAKPAVAPPTPVGGSNEQDSLLERYRLEIQREQRDCQERISRIADVCMLSIHSTAERLLEDTSGKIFFAVSATKRLQDGLVFPPHAVQTFFYSAYLEAVAAQGPVSTHQGLGYKLTVTKVPKGPPRLECEGPHTGHVAMLHMKGGFEPVNA